ncbi:MAG: class I SAM-dependent methyltransferase [Planctomycetota bacterium]|jgi:predicted O-methyltransferase YrrM
MKPYTIDDIKHLVAIGRNPGPTGDAFLDGRYQWQAVDNAVEWPYYRFFFHLAGMLEPGFVVELGGFQGTAAAHFAAGCSKSLVITIDHHSDPGDEENRAKMQQAAALYPNLQYVRGWTTDAEAEAQRGHHALGDAPSAYPHVLAAGRKIDILFIDSWHVYEHARLDWEAYSPLLSKGALVICDDITDEDRPGFAITGMRRFWDELEGPKFLDGNNLHPGTRMGFLKYET